MADAWGGSWGTAWASSWGADGTTPSGPVAVGRISSLKRRYTRAPKQRKYREELGEIVAAIEALRDRDGVSEERVEAIAESVEQVVEMAVPAEIDRMVSTLRSAADASRLVDRLRYLRAAERLVAQIEDEDEVEMLLLS